MDPNPKTEAKHTSKVVYIGIDPASKLGYCYGENLSLFTCGCFDIDKHFKPKKSKNVLVAKNEEVEIEQTLFETKKKKVAKPKKGKKEKAPPKYVYDQTKAVRDGIKLTIVYQFFEKLINEVKLKYPEYKIILLCEDWMYFNSRSFATLQFLIRLQGVIQLFCANNEIEMDYILLATARKNMLGTSKGTKEEVHEKIKEKYFTDSGITITDPDQIDAYVIYYNGIKFNSSKK